MKEVICISHPQRLRISSWSSLGHSEEAPGKVISWHSEELEAPLLISCVAAFDSISHFNCISIDLHKEYSSFFPSKLRFEISLDGQVWEPLVHEAAYKPGPHKKAVWNFPLSCARYLKFVFLADKKNLNSKYFIAFGEVQISIAGAANLKVSSELDRLWVKDNIIDRRPEYGWSTAPRAHLEREYIEMDLGSVNRIAELRALSKDDPDTFFPLSFQLFYSDDNISWHLLFEERSFLAEPACWYKWRFLPVNARYMRFLILEGARTREAKYMSQLIEIEIYAHAEILSANAAQGVPILASTLRSGLVRLAADGEYKEGLAVQANDKRLHSASCESEGIVELAADGESNPRVAVQGNDKRLKYATEDMAGIVRLARNEEVRTAHVVQSDDSRLKPASTDKAGLVQLARDGESHPNSVVQANDKRLQNASTRQAGLVTLAQSGEASPNRVVQGNDLRLTQATVERAGLLRFARHNEAAPEAAVQANDPRFQKASTARPGIVELARDGERQAGKVLQSNDIRVQPATEKQAGIVQLAAPGSNLEQRAVQAHDPRLHDARKALPHKHDYAPLKHDLSSHEGALQISAKQGKGFQGIAKAPKGHAPIYSVNEGGGAAIVGQGHKEGLLGASPGTGVLAFGMGKGTGLVAAAQKNAAGVFISEQNYSLVAGGRIKDRNLASSSLALLTQGLSRFNNTICLSQGMRCIASYFFLGEKEDLRPGDLLCITKNGDRVHRARESHSKSVLGVVVKREQAGIILDSPAELLPQGEAPAQGPFAPPIFTDKVLVAISGIVEVQVYAERRPLNAGQLLVSSMESGFAEALDLKAYEPGTVFARSLGSLSKGRGRVRALLCLA